jgi:hypothetical protein
MQRILPTRLSHSIIYKKKEKESNVIAIFLYTQHLFYNFFFLAMCHVTNLNLIAINYFHFKLDLSDRENNAIE